MSQAQDLASFTRVCLSWSELALDRLWEDRLPSLIPLIRILGPWIKIGDSWTCNFDLWDADWARFRLFAARVRVLRHTDNPYNQNMGYLSSHYLDKIASSAPTGFGPLLPHVRVINWTVFHDIPSFTHICTFISPSVKEVDFVTGGTIEVDVALGIAQSHTLRRLAERPLFANLHLTHLSMRWLSDLYPELYKSLAAFLMKQVTIRSLRLHTLPAETVVSQAISHLPSLQNLHLGIVFTSSDSISTLCATLTSHPSSSLAKISLQLVPTDDFSPLPFRRFSPLLRLQSLVSCEIGYSLGIILEDVDIMDMGRSWPLLETLKLDSGNSDPDPPLSILLVISKWLGNSLKELALQVSFEDIPVFDDTISEARFPSLHTLDFIESKPPRPPGDKVADFLSRILPPGIDIRYLVPRGIPAQQVEVEVGWESIKSGVKEKHYRMEHAAPTR